MPLLTLPLIAWGSAEDLSTWSQNGTATVASGITDPFGGTGAYSVQDNDGAGFEYRYKTWVQPTSGTAWAAVFLKDDTGTGDVTLWVYDQTAAATRVIVTYSFASNALTGTTLQSGGGTYPDPISVGGGWFLAILGAASCVAGNTHQLRLLPGSAASNGQNTAYFYVRNVVLLDYLGEATSFPRPRRGSVWAQAASGTEDAWIVGTDEILRGRVRWVPREATTSPVLKSGWDGQNEIVGVNCGVKALLTAGRAKSALTWVPDRSACTTAQSAYLSVPEEADAVELEGNGDRAMTIELRSTSPFVGL